MAPKHRLTRAYLLSLSIFSLSSIVIMAVLWISYEYNRSEDESHRTTSGYFEALETSLGVETNRVVDYLEAQTASSQVRFYINIKTRVQDIHSMLSRFVAERGEAGLEDGRARSDMLAVLRHLSYGGGRGGYFCASLDGTVLLDGLGPPGAPDAPAPGFDPKLLAQALESVSIVGEGFYRLPLTGGPSGAPNPAAETPVTYLKRIPELGWVVGASEYHSDFERDLGNELIRWIDNAPLPPEESLLVMDNHGRVLSYRDPSLVGVNIIEKAPATGLGTAAARILKGARERSKGFERFTLRPPGGSGADAGTEYVAHYRAVPGWSWVVANLVNIGDLDEALKNQRKLLSRNLRRAVGQIVITTAATLLIILIISTIVSRKAESSLSAFFKFFDKAATSSIEIDAGAQPFEEFARLAEAANSMIRERREADRKLSDSEQRFRTFFNVSPEIITIIDGRGRVIESNREFERFSGRLAADAQGRDLGEILGADARVWEAMMVELAEGGRIEGRELVVERVGSKAHLLVFAKTMPLLEESPVLWVGVDVTARRLAEIERAELQERLARSRTMESMGRMATTVAHELNNILSALIGYPELLLEDETLAPAYKAQVREILDAGLRASAVVGDLLTLASGVATAKARVRVDDLIAKVVTGQGLTKALSASPKPVAVETRLDSKAVVKGSQAHLRKVVANLVQNAIDALADRGGRIVVSSRLVRLDEDPGGFESFSPGDHLELTVADDGPGIPQADLPRIFEPFLSNKPGSGHGLGLALVQLTVREHGGAVSISTSPEGTTFKVLLPAKLAGPERPAASREQLKGRGQKILVVDDVDIQRKLAQKMLKSLGYDPHAVSSGEEAVDFLRDHDVDLIILDMIMDPGINGRQTYEAILSFKPWQKAIIASGMAESDEVLRAQSLGASQFVSKPYTLDEIAGAVHKALHPDPPMEGA